MKQSGSSTSISKKSGELGGVKKTSASSSFSSSETSLKVMLSQPLFRSEKSVRNFYLTPHIIIQGLVETGQVVVKFFCAFG